MPASFSKCVNNVAAGRTGGGTTHRDKERLLYKQKPIRSFSGGLHTACCFGVRSSLDLLPAS